MNLNAKIVTIALPERLKYAKSRVSETNFEENDKNVLILKWYLMEISRKYMPNILQHFFLKVKSRFSQKLKKRKTESQCHCLSNLSLALRKMTDLSCITKWLYL